MRSLRLLALATIVLGGVTFDARAQRPKPVVGGSEVHWVLTLDVPAGNMDKFQQLAAEMVASTKQEAGALDHEFAATPDQKTAAVVERYRDSEAVVVQSRGSSTSSPSASSRW